MQPKQRTFSKRLVVVNCALAWATLAYAIGTGQAAAVAAYVFSFIATLAGCYLGVGHLDLRQFIAAALPVKEPANA
jgi:hypothetical protein